jgi:hypothetical protein
MVLARLQTPGHLTSPSCDTRQSKDFASAEEHAYILGHPSSRKFVRKGGLVYVQKQTLL